jgi:hypothetical protein
MRLKIKKPKLRISNHCDLPHINQNLEVFELKSLFSEKFLKRNHSYYWKTFQNPLLSLLAIACTDNSAKKQTVKEEPIKFEDQMLWTDARKFFQPEGIR